MDTVTVVLPKIYGWVFPGDKHATNYGPGKVEIPQAMAEGLIREGVLPPVLPADFPAHDALMNAGYTTLDAVREVEDLTEIDGIGKVTAGKIRKALK